MHGQFYQVLHARKSAPTDRERSLASGATELTEAIVAEYVEMGKRLNQNVKAMFEKQAAEARVRIFCCCCFLFAHIVYFL